MVVPMSTPTIILASKIPYLLKFIMKWWKTSCLLFKRENKERIEVGLGWQLNENFTWDGPDCRQITTLPEKFTSNHKWSLLLFQKYLPSLAFLWPILGRQHQGFINSLAKKNSSRWERRRKTKEEKKKLIDSNYTKVI